MKRVFADSAFWIGLRDRSDIYHPRSRLLVQWVARHRCVLVITPFILAETQAYFSRVPEIKKMVIRDLWENPIVQIEQTTFEDQKHAIKILQGQHDKNYSFADAVSFTVMMRLQLNEVITYDRHFAQFGHFDVIDGANL